MNGMKKKIELSFEKKEISLVTFWGQFLFTHIYTWNITRVSLVSVILTDGEVI